MYKVIINVMNSLARQLTCTIEEHGLACNNASCILVIHTLSQLIMVHCDFLINQPIMTAWVSFCTSTHKFNNARSHFYIKIILVTVIGQKNMLHIMLINFSTQTLLAHGLHKQRDTWMHAEVRFVINTNDHCTLFGINGIPVSWTLLNAVRTIFIQM